MTTNTVHKQPFAALLDFFRDYPGRPTPENQEGKTNLDLLEQQMMSVSESAGPYANMHLDPDT